MRTDAFDYQLPAELIAPHPATERDASRLLVLGDPARSVVHSRFSRLGEHLPPGALLVANDTRVIPARLAGRRPTGGAVELLLVAPLEDGETACRWSALARANRPLRIGDRIDVDEVVATVEHRGERGAVELRLETDADGVTRLLERSGEVPLPPYIKRAPVAEDQQRYQTIYARHDGSVAAPTAGLHFTPTLIDELRAAGHDLVYVTLHVGPGTFRPIVTTELTEHRMDAERYEIDAATVEAIDSARAAGRPVIAVGTTVVRTLEGCVADHGGLRAGAGTTELFIQPGFEFAVIDGLITNFHLPRSTLLCLVAALAGRERILAAYRTAVAERYRFYSYGDAMLILPEAR